MRPTYESFKGNDLPVADVHDWLEGKAEFKTHFTAGIYWIVLNANSMLISHNPLPGLEGL
jgi:hypothetical protein